jgi:hypothetical protein
MYLPTHRQLKTEFPSEVVIYFLHPVVYHVTKEYLGAVNAAVDYKPIIIKLV